MGFFAQNAQKWAFWLKMAVLAIFDPFSTPAGRGFTSTPRAGAPRYRKRGSGGEARETPKNGVLGPFSPNSGNLAFSASRGRDPRGTPGTPPGNRGAPARGVDVKPPSPGGPGPGPGGCPGPWPARSPLRASGRPPGALRAPSGAPGTPSGALDAGVLHQPLAPGPRGSRRGSGGPSPGPGVRGPFPGLPGLTPAPPRG